MESVFTRARLITGAGLGATAVFCGGFGAATAHADVRTSPVAATAPNATAPKTSPGASTATPAMQNGPLIYRGYESGFMPGKGSYYSVNPDGSGRHVVVSAITGTDPDPTTALRNSPALKPPVFDPTANHLLESVVASPDGTQLAYFNTDGRIWVSNADGTGMRPLTAVAPIDSGTGKPQWSDVTPAWSPDGKSVLFTRATSMTVAPVYSVDVASGPGTEKPFKGLNGYCLSIGVNGTMTYETIDDDGLHQIVADASGHAINTFTSPEAQGLGVISPDGTKLAMLMPSGPIDPKTRVPVTDLYVASAEDGFKTLTRLTYGGDVTFFVQAAWSPDSTKLAYTTGGQKIPMSNDPHAEPMDLHIQDAVAGSTPTTVVTDSIESVTWRAVPAPPPLPPTPPVTPPTTPPATKPIATRLGGQDRVDTAIAVSQAAYGPQNKAKAAVLSRSDSFADALAGNALAAQKGGPLLLTGTAGLDPRVAAELQRTLAPGATVYVLGGTSALSPKVEKDLAALHLTAKRLAGPTRYDTAVAIAREISPNPHSVLVATGTNAPDALAAGAAAAQDPHGGVVLLSQDGTLPAATKAYLAGVNPAATAVYGVGGQGVTALNTLPALAGRFTPLKGANRYQTDVAVASNEALFPKPAAAGLATGRTWPDALSGGAFIATLHGPLLLSDGPNVPPEIAAWMAAHGAALSSLTVFGGNSAVPYDTARGIAADAWGPANWVNKLQ